MPPEMNGQNPAPAMTPEDLLKMLRDSGLDDEGIKNLLSETMASLEGSAENTEAAQAGDLLGVEL